MPVIIGIGMDLIEVDRVNRCIQFPRFVQRVFTANEQEYMQSRNMNPQTAAGIFAAKEAVAKALGTGFGRIHWTDIEILRNEAGRPYVMLYGEAQEELRHLGGGRLWVSITHLKALAAAQAVIEE